MRKKGFTLIELLVVIAIIGLLSTLAVVALNSARLKARDAKRVADIKQVQTALELYFNDNNSYPIMGGAPIVLGSGATCLGDGGFGTSCSAPVYMGLLPTNPTPNGADYSYTSVSEGGGDCGSEPCSTYAITFTLEGTTGGLGSGAHTASQDGLQ
ncbi:MAG: type II secretion system protein [Patescibacteria group bacterium]|nr:type II secretion system protein [Patescibacteria group bacterium]